MAGRLRGTLRESDTAARLGGDEFGVLLPEPGERASVLLVARRILDALAPPCVIHGLPHRVGASIGVALYPQHGTDADTLLHRADTAMYTAKQTRGTVVIAALAPPHDAPAPAGAARRPPSPMEMVTGAPGPGAGVAARDLNERLLVAGLREQALAEQLRRQLAFTTAITANIGEGVCALDPEGRITFVNPEAARLLGWPAADLPGQRLHDLVQHGCGDDCPLADALRTGMSVRIDDDRFARRDGTRLPVAYSVSPIVADGLGVGAVVAFRDITRAKRADERQRFLAEAGAALAESLDSATTLAKVAQLAVPGLADWCFVDVLEDGHVERLAVAHAEPARAPLAGEVRRFPARPEGHPRHAPSLALAGGQVVFMPTLAEDDVRAMAQDDAHLRALLAIGPRSLIAVPLVAHGRPLGVLTFIATPESGRHFDMDDLALAEELARRCALALANAHLYRREQEAVHLREQFLTIAAHELRTPITTVRGYADLLRRQLDRPVPDRARVDRYLDQCDDGVRRMDLLIGNLLDVARSQQGQLVLQRAPCDLAALAREVLARATASPEHTSAHTATLDAPGVLIGKWDRDRLDQVLTNLVSNALKYSPAGGAVRLAIQDDAQGHAVITVTDQGIGIPPTAQRTLFQPFARGAAATGTIGGTGLGLYIVRQIVVGHGGAITLASAPGVSTTIMVTLPLAPPDPATPPVTVAR